MLPLDGAVFPNLCASESPGMRFKNADSWAPPLEILIHHVWASVCILKRTGSDMVDQG